MKLTYVLKKKKPSWWPYVTKDASRLSWLRVTFSLCTYGCGSSEWHWSLLYIEVMLPQFKQKLQVDFDRFKDPDESEPDDFEMIDDNKVF